MRRSERLERKKQEILNGTYREAEPDHRPRASFDDDDFNAEEIEELEEELLDAATAAQTVEELNAELLELADLDRDRASGSATPAPTASGPSCRTILQDNALTTDANGWPRKFIIFTEHRDTLDYLAGQDRLAARQARRRQGDPRRRAPRASAARSPRSSPRTATARSCSPPTPPARASTSRPRT